MTTAVDFSDDYGDGPSSQDWRALATATDSSDEYGDCLDFEDWLTLAAAIEASDEHGEELSFDDELALMTVTDPFDEYEDGLDPQDWADLIEKTGAEPTLPDAHGAEPWPREVTFLGQEQAEIPSVQSSASDSVCSKNTFVVDYINKHGIVYLRKRYTDLKAKCEDVNGHLLTNAADASQSYTGPTSASKSEAPIV
ncbi:MAG: hypothetical protein Q9181_000487 [Wetmoreana brouardii]